MKLCDKLRYLREVEGTLRGLGRAMTQGELVRAIGEEMKSAHGSLSQSYLSQIESGARPHLTNTTRLLLAKFFKVHPGYLVDDPEGYHAELMSDLPGSGATFDEKLDLWLIGGAERFRRDPDLCRALLEISKHEDSRTCLLLLESVLETPQLAERLLELLRPSSGAKAPSLVGTAVSGLKPGPPPVLKPGPPPVLKPGPPPVVRPGRLPVRKPGPPLARKPGLPLVPVAQGVKRSQVLNRKKAVKR